MLPSHSSRKESTHSVDDDIDVFTGDNLKKNEKPSGSQVAKIKNMFVCTYKIKATHI